MNQLLLKFKQSSIVLKLVYINLAVFVLTLLLNSLGFLLQFNFNILLELFALPSQTSNFISQPWSIITYGFMHGGFWHLISNLLVLYYIGNLFIDYFTQRQLLSFYLFGTVFGGLLYLVCFAFLPAFQGVMATMVGASAAVMAIFIGIATYIPNYQLHIRFIGYVKLWHLAGLFVLLDLVQIPAGNAGGHIAHLGGALFGFLYMAQIKKGNLSIKISNPFADIFKRKSNLKTVYKSKKKKSTSKASNKSNQQIIDAILDKISKSGYDSLSKEEKNILFKQGNGQT